jgi:hypothetical protein
MAETLGFSIPGARVERREWLKHWVFAIRGAKRREWEKHWENAVSLHTRRFLGVRRVWRREWGSV